MFLIVLEPINIVSFSPLPMHVDSGFDEEAIIYKQVVTPLMGPGDTIFFKKRWYGKSTTFTIDKDELNFKPKPEQNDRSNKHLGKEDFDPKIHAKYSISWNLFWISISCSIVCKKCM